VWEIDSGRRELRFDGKPLLLGARAFDVLEILVEAKGRLVSRDELMERVWPREHVVATALRVHIAAIRRTLGADQGLLKTSPGQGYQLLGDWATHPMSSPTDAAAIVAEDVARPFTIGLPLAATDLIGRANVVQRVLDILSAYRIVTLMGPGGVGKTALASEIARILSPAFQGNVAFIELASLSDRRLVASVSASTLGLQFGGGEISAHAVARAIGDRRLLLVLDNCEHVIDEAATLAETVAHLCRNTCILATSREMLRISGEHLYRVPPLDLPPPHDEGSEQLGDYSAVQLFVARATANDSGFEPNQQGLTRIASICRRLDGIPLAIEFAAAHASILGLAQIDAYLNNRFGLLISGRRTALPRHRTLRAMLDWSYDLLPEHEQSLLRRLAVFPGRFNLMAAEAVAPDIGTGSVAMGVMSLGAKSLVTLDEPSGGDWRLLETIRSYARGKLAECGETDLASRYHATYIRDLVVSLSGGSTTAQIDKDNARLSQLADDGRAAIDWAFGPGGDFELGIALTASFAPVWLRLSLLVECRERVKQALDCLGTGASADGRLLLPLYIAFGVTVLETTHSGLDCVAAYDRALQLAENLNDVAAQLRVLRGIFGYRNTNDEQDAARLIARRYAVLVEQTTDPSYRIVASRFLALATHYSGEQRAAQRHIERARALYVEAGDQPMVPGILNDERVQILTVMARVLWMRGEVEEAWQTAKEAFEHARTIGHNASICYALGAAVCPIALGIGELDAAETSIALLTDIAGRYNSALWTSLGPGLLGALLCRRGEFAEGARLLLTAYDRFEAMGLSLHFAGFHGDLAEALAALRRPTDGLAIIDRALERCDRGKAVWYKPELLRTRGELLLRQQPGDIAEPEACLQRALELAEQQAALFWQLRSAVSLARLLNGQQARQILARVYMQFAQGFETSDLRAAKTILGT
jgi:predicted ATPase/DNA-binding winged helix-turn-helix (wHTH) protein